MNKIYSPFVLADNPLPQILWEEGAVETGNRRTNRARYGRPGLTQRDMEVISLLERHGFLTTLQVYQLVYGHTSLRTAKARLRKLQQLGLVQAFRWCYPGGRTPSVRVFTLPAMGNRQLPGTKGIQPTRVDVEEIFKVLVVNELYLNLLKCSKGFPPGQGLLEMVIRPPEIPWAAGSFRFAKEAYKDFLVWVLRRGGGNLYHEVNRIISYYNQSAVEQKAPVLLVVGEDDNQLRALHVLIRDYHLPCRFTTDGRFMGRPLHEKGALVKFEGAGILQEVEADFFRK